jgi:hypothetical protein
MIEHSEIIKKLTPPFQFGGSIVLGIVVALFSFLFLPGNANEFSGAFIGILFYAIINNVLSIFNSSFKKYSLPSYGYYFLLVAMLLLFAKFLSHKSIWELPEFRFMFSAVTIFYLTTSVLVRVIRAIYEFALAEDEAEID